MSAVCKIGFRCLVVVLAALTLTACSGGSGNGASNESPAAALQRNRSRWSSRAITSYRYVLQSSHFGSPETTSPVVIEVRPGAEPVIRSLDPNTPILTDYFRRYDTVEKLFDTIQSAMDSHADRLSARYDYADGFPTSIQVDPSKALADEEFSLQIRDFTMLP